MKFAGGEVENVDENIPRVSQISDGRREEVLGSKHSIVIPAFNAVGLHESARVEMRLCEIAFQQRLPSPPDLA